MGCKVKFLEWVCVDVCVRERVRETGGQMGEVRVCVLSNVWRNSTIPKKKSQKKLKN